ncbi:hypothetical protein [Lentilactobacillus sp. Marseille-Q4993]|uniref:hypothetical protein n=1 Tax=Lentilactobacillus sp. Marseille-Q4993 TaxID=3039492 RepID=UPI0024BC041D|nr:hypothetical protein [Lentilactobacillus sp. Marseille-Q4993]
MKKGGALLMCGLLPLLALAGCSTSGNSSNSNSQSQKQTSTNNPKFSEYKKKIEIAKNLNESGNYEGSSNAMNGIKEADLNKNGFSSLKTEYFKIKRSNDSELSKSTKKQNTESQKSDKKNVDLSTNDSFSNYSKFVGDYSFYDPDSDRSQSDLEIDSDGKIVKSNDGGKSSHGVATVSPETKDVLSYDVTTDTDKTKTISSNVRVDVTWSNGDTETYYGYTSYAGDSVLTDGQSRDGGVNEVWVQ